MSREHTGARSPRISVITAAFNAREHLSSCIESVRRESEQGVEHIVIDGGSTDGTVDLLRARSADVAFWSSEQDGGIYHAWNKGLRVARAEWICFLGADDTLLPGAVSAYLDCASQQPAAEFISSRVRWRFADSGTRVVGRAWEWESFREYMTVAHPGALHRRTLFDRVGEFNQSYKSAADYELLLRAGPYLRAAFLDQVTVEMQAGGRSESLLSVRETVRAQIATRAASAYAARSRGCVAAGKLLLRRLVRRAA